MRTWDSLREAGKEWERTLRGGSPTATGRSTRGMWQAMQVRPDSFPAGACIHCSGVPATRWQVAQASTVPARRSKASLHCFPPRNST